MVNDITFFTYTHSNCKDLWPIYFDLLDRNAPGFKSVVASDVWINEYKNHQFIAYEDKNYCQELADIVQKNVKTEYMIYMQEDFFLYDKINLSELEYIKKFLDETIVSYVRLIKCGDITEIPIKEKLYWVQTPDSKHNSITSVSFQPTIWKTNDYIEVYRNTPYTKFQEGIEFANAMNKLNYYAAYYYNGEPQRGRMHCDSSVFPYIATAIVKGKWNMSEYSVELNSILSQYNIDSSLRDIC